MGVRKVACLEGPGTHLSLVLIACRSYQKKRHFTGPPLDQLIAVPFDSTEPGKAPNIDRRRLFYGKLLHEDFWGATTDDEH
jgi:hypothetical protein